MDLWGFIDGNYRVPSRDELSVALSLMGDYEVTAAGDGFEIALPEGMSLDLGGIAKGYASDLICQRLSEDGYSSALVCLGGNIAATGPKPDGTDWKIGVRDPDGTENDYVGVVSLSSGCVVSSGDYKRYFESEGNIYHHIIDPSTGYPAESGLRSVTIVSPSGTTADGLSTALFVMGLDKALSFWRSSDDFEAVFITDDHRVILRPDWRNVFSGRIPRVQL
jgi:thiamine biosynthesis lipoprotein